jgi:hypothetical protein
MYIARDVMILMKANSFQGQLEGAHTKSTVLIFKTCQKIFIYNDTVPLTFRPGMGGGVS